MTRALFPCVSMSQYLYRQWQLLHGSSSHLFWCCSLSAGGMDLSTMRTVLAHCLIHSFFISAILTQVGWVVTCLPSAQHYLGIGVTHHSNQEVKEKDDKQCNEEEPVDFSWNICNHYQLKLLKMNKPINSCSVFGISSQISWNPPRVMMNIWK